MQEKQIYHLAVLYPGTMANGITAWLEAAQEAGLDVDVLLREDGTADDGTAVIGAHDESGSYERWTLRTYARYTLSSDAYRGSESQGLTTVLETRPTDGSEHWRYYEVGSYPTGQPCPEQWHEDGSPYLVVADQVANDHELFVLRTPDGARRAGVVYGMGAEFAAWRLGAQHLAAYELDYYALDGDLRRPVGSPQTSADLAEGVHYWENKTKAREEATPTRRTKPHRRRGSTEIPTPKPDQEPLTDWELELLSYQPRDLAQVSAAHEEALDAARDDWEAAMAEAGYLEALRYEDANALSEVVRRPKWDHPTDTASGYCHQVRERVRKEAKRLGLALHQP